MNSGDILVNKLGRLPDFGFVMSTAEDTPESKEFGELIAGLVEESGCVLAGTSHSKTSSAEEQKGVVVLYPHESPPPIAVALANALKKVGIPGVTLVHSESLGRVTLHIGAHRALEKMAI